METWIDIVLYILLEIEIEHHLVAEATGLFTSWWNFIIAKGLPDINFTIYKVIELCCEMYLKNNSQDDITMYTVDSENMYIFPCMPIHIMCFLFKYIFVTFLKLFVEFHS